MKTKITTESNPGLPQPCEYTHYCDCVLCRGEPEVEVPPAGAGLPIAWGFLILLVGILLILW